MTHGFFKGLLFLGSGSVIHAVHEEQDMNRMGGLWRKIPITHWTMLVGTIAIAGIPPLAGLLLQGRDPGRGVQVRLVDGVAIGYSSGASASSSPCMTAFYMWRLMGKTFYGAVARRPARGAEDPRVARGR